MTLLTLQIHPQSEMTQVEKLGDKLEELGIDAELVIIEDQNTSPEFNEFSLNQRLKVLRIRNSGDFLINFDEAMQRSSGEYILVVDSSARVSGEFLAVLLDKALEGYDLVLGSRSGKTGLRTLIAKILVRELSGIRDPLSNVFIARREVLENIELRTGVSTMLAEIVIKNRSARIAEVPLKAHARRRNAHVSPQSYLAYLWSVLTLSKFRVVKFALVGVTGIGVNEGLLYLLDNVFSFYFSGLHLLILPVASIIAVEASIIWNFTLNNSWTFSDRKSGSILMRLLKYNVFTGIGSAVNVAATVGLTDYAILPDYLVANLIGIMFGFFINYFSSDYLVWKISGNRE